MEGISNIIGERWKADVLDMSNVHRIGTNLTRPQSIFHKCKQRIYCSEWSDHQLQVREDDAWMKSTAVVNKEERELLFKVVAEMPHLSKLDLTGMNISSSAHTSPLYQDDIIISHTDPYHRNEHFLLCPYFSFVSR